MVAGATPSTWNFWVNWRQLSEIANFEPIFALSASAVTPSEKSLINTNMKSTTRFPMSLRWSSYVAPKPPPKRAQNAKQRFWCKIALRLKKVCYKVSLCENCQRQSCMAFIGLTIRAKMIGGTTPSTWNFGSNWPRWREITNFWSIFSRSASAVTPSEKSSINVNRKSTTRFSMSLRWTSYVVPNPPKGDSTTKCPKFEQ